MAGNEGIWRVVQRRPVIALSARQLGRLPVWVVPALSGTAVGVLEYTIADAPVVDAAADAWQVAAVVFIMVAKAAQVSLPRTQRLSLLGSILLAAIVGSASIPHSSAREFDWLYVSGILAWMVGIEFSERADAIFDRTLRSLMASGVARVTNGELRAIRRGLLRRKSLYRRRGGLWVAVAIALAWLALGIFLLVSLGGVAYLRYLPLLFVSNSGIVLVEVLAAVVAGQYIGEMVAYAAAWQALQPKLNLIPGHPDGTLGLKMVGRFYFRQALISGIPAAYLAIWWYIIPAFPWYADWRDIYLGLLVVAVTIEIMAFFLPMRAIHRAMIAERNRRSLEADRLMMRIGKLQEDLVNAMDHESRDNMSKELAILLDWVRTLRMLPTWPVDPALRRWFTLSNFALFIPFFSYVVGNPRLWGQVGSILGGLKHLQQCEQGNAASEHHGCDYRRGDRAEHGERHEAGHAQVLEEASGDVAERFRAQVDADPHAGLDEMRDERRPATKSGRPDCRGRASVRMLGHDDADRAADDRPQGSMNDVPHRVQYRDLAHDELADVQHTRDS